MIEANKLMIMLFDKLKLNDFQNLILLASLITMIDFDFSN